MQDGRRDRDTVNTKKTSRRGSDERYEPGPEWNPSSWDEIAIGDLVTVRLMCDFDDGTGKPVVIYDGVRAQPRRARFVFEGRLVDDDIAKPGNVLVERTRIVDRVDTRIIVPPVLVSFGERDLKRRGACIWVRATGNPPVPAGPERIRYLQDLLIDAAGGNHEDPLALARVAACIHPEEVTGAEPKRVGEYRARMMLMGEDPFSEMVWHQLLAMKPAQNAASVSVPIEDAQVSTIHERADGEAFGQIRTGEQNASICGRKSSDDRERFVARIVEQKAMVRSRLRDGFRHLDWGQVIVGRTFASFVEHGLRSESLGFSGRLFVRGCRKAKHLRGGNDKSVMLPLGPSKVLSLDAPYIEGNRVMISLLRTDLDLTFPSVQHAIAAIQAVVDAGDLPCMPHLICGDVGPARITTMDDDGFVHETFYPAALIRPHVWTILPQGSAVNAGPKGRKAPKQLLAGVARGINASLLHLGADPAASPFLVRGKNPLSPYLWSAALNNDEWPTLSEWAQWVDTRISPERLSRQAAEVQSGLDKGPSNVAFSSWQRTAYDLLRTAHRAGDPAYLVAVQPSVDPGALADLLRQRMPLADLDRDPAWSDVAAERVLERVITFAAASWDPSKAEVVRVARGAMMHETDGMATRKAQAASGKRSASLNASRTLSALVNAYRSIVEAGVKPNQTTVSKAAGIGRRTAVTRWSDVLAEV